MNILIQEPKIQLAQVTTNSYLSKSNYYPIMLIGMCNLNNLYRILIKFHINNIPADAEILASRLKLILIPNKTKYRNIITPYAITEKWDIDTVTWNNQPAFNPHILGKSVNVKRKSHYIFDITSIVQLWHLNKLQNNGIVLKNQEVCNKSFVETLINIEKSYKPQIEIFYKCKDSCQAISTKFIDNNEEFDTDDSYKFSKLRNTSLTKTVMFFIQNLEMNKITAHIQVSPDGINFIDEYTEICVGMNEITYIVPCIFAKFTRVAVKTINTHQTSRIKIWYQAQE